MNKQDIVLPPIGSLVVTNPRRQATPVYNSSGMIDMLRSNETGVVVSHKELRGNNANTQYYGFVEILTPRNIVGHAYFEYLEVCEE
jgi:hypothetical protein